MQISERATPPQAAPRERIRVAIADPFPVVLIGLRQVLQDDPRFEIVVEVSSLPSLLESMADEPAVAVVDWSLAIQELPTTISMMQSPLRKPSFIFLSSSEDAKEKSAMLKLGARDVLSKRVSPIELQNAVWNAGKRWITAKVESAAVSLTIKSPAIIGSHPDERIRQLTRRERELIPLVCGGMSNKSVAHQLGIAQSTVWHHLTAIFNKLGVADRMGLAAFAYGHGLVESAARVNLADAS